MPSKQLPWTTSIARTASGVEQRGIEDTIGGRSNQIDGLKLTLTGVVCYYVSAFEILWSLNMISKPVWRRVTVAALQARYIPHISWQLQLCKESSKTQRSAPELGPFFPDQWKYNLSFTQKKKEKEHLAARSLYSTPCKHVPSDTKANATKLFSPTSKWPRRLAMFPHMVPHGIGYPYSSTTTTFIKIYWMASVHPQLTQQDKLENQNTYFFLDDPRSLFRGCVSNSTCVRGTPCSNGNTSFRNLETDI